MKTIWLPLSLVVGSTTAELRFRVRFPGREVLFVFFSLGIWICTGMPTNLIKMFIKSVCMLKYLYESLWIPRRDRFLIITLWFKIVSLGFLAHSSLWRSTVYDLWNFQLQYFHEVLCLVTVTVARLIFFLFYWQFKSACNGLIEINTLSLRFPKSF